MNMLIIDRNKLYYNHKDYIRHPFDTFNIFTRSLIYDIRTFNNRFRYYLLNKNDYRAKRKI